MRPDWNRLYRICVAFAAGGTPPGFLQGFGLVSFSTIAATLLATWLSALVAILLGADPSTFV